MRTDKFDLVITVAGGTGNVAWSDLISNWIIDSVEVSPPGSGSYDLRINTSAGSGVLHETSLTGKTTVPCGRSQKGPFSIIIQNAVNDGTYNVSIITKG